MTDRPYSRLYHCLADEYPDIYDGPFLADYMRLLVAADQSYPTRAKWSGNASKRAVEALAGAGLIVIDGARYVVKGMDKERAERSARASHAAHVRYAGSTASSSAGGNAVRMPSKDETSRDETRREHLGRTTPLGVVDGAAIQRRVSPR